MKSMVAIHGIVSVLAVLILAVVYLGQSHLRRRLQSAERPKLFHYAIMERNHKRIALPFKFQPGLGLAVAVLGALLSPVLWRRYGLIVGLMFGLGAFLFVRILYAVCMRIFGWGIESESPELLALVALVIFIGGLVAGGVLSARIGLAVAISDSRMRMTHLEKSGWVRIARYQAPSRRAALKLHKIATQPVRTMRPSPVQKVLARFRRRRPSSPG